MTSIAQEKLTTATAERAVFVTDDDRRSRIARRLALATLAVATLWLAALAVGMLGFGQLPGVSLPLPAGGGKAKQHEQRPVSTPTARSGSVRAVVAAARVNRAAVVRASALTATTALHSRPKSRSSTFRTRTAPARRRAAEPVTATSPPAAQPATASRVARGLERRGLTTPPGQAQKAAAPTKTPQGQTKTPQGQVKRTDATQPAPPPPPAPPGQQKPDKPPAKA
jgi:hypothetical protein